LEGKHIIKTILKELGINKEIIRTKSDSDKHHPKKQVMIEITTKD
jgi:hypothetical protein